MKTTSKCSSTIHGNGANKLVDKGAVKAWFIVEIGRHWVTVGYREQNLGGISVKSVIFAPSCIFSTPGVYIIRILLGEKLLIKKCHKIVEDARSFFYKKQRMWPILEVS